MNLAAAVELLLDQGNSEVKHYDKKNELPLSLPGSIMLPQERIVKKDNGLYSIDYRELIDNSYNNHPVEVHIQKSILPTYLTETLSEDKLWDDGTYHFRFTSEQIETLKKMKMLFSGEYNGHNNKIKGDFGLNLLDVDLETSVRKMDHQIGYYVTQFLDMGNAVKYPNNPEELEAIVSKANASLTKKKTQTVFKKKNEKDKGEENIDLSQKNEKPDYLINIGLCLAVNFDAGIGHDSMLYIFPNGYFYEEPLTKYNRSHGKRIFTKEIEKNRKYPY